MRIDLHVHSTASDGTDSPSAIVHMAAAAGLSVVALTDHDTVGGHDEAVAAVTGTGITLVRGAELSCMLGGISLHLLAYLFDPQYAELAAELHALRTDRIRRARVMTAKLAELGAPVTWERVAELAGDGSVGRPHMAMALVEAGVVPDVASAFTPEWLADGGRAYVEKYSLDPFRAVELVHAAGGVTVFAHPAASSRGRIVDVEVIRRLAAGGLDGIEVDHPDHDTQVRRELRELAADAGLLATGSSDYHGFVKDVRLGENTTSPAVYAALVDRAEGLSLVAG